MQAPNDLVSVYSTNNPSEAEIIRAALQGEGIKCEIGGENQAGLAGIISMEIQVQVRAEDSDRARKYLELHLHEH